MIRAKLNECGEDALWGTVVNMLDYFTYNGIKKEL
jgi:hypothetical protein